MNMDMFCVCSDKQDAIELTLRRNWKETFYFNSLRKEKTMVCIYLGLDSENQSGLEITMKNHCDGDIFEHSFRL